MRRVARRARLAARALSGFSEFNAIWHTPAQSWETLDTLKRIEPPYTRLPVYQRDADHEQVADHPDAALQTFSPAAMRLPGWSGSAISE